MCVFVSISSWYYLDICRVLPLSELLPLYTHSTSLRSAHQLLSVSRTFWKFRGDWVFVGVATKLWNELPLHIRQASSTSIIKWLLKTHWFTLASSTAWFVDIFIQILVFYLFYYTFMWTHICDFIFVLILNFTMKRVVQDWCLQVH